MCVYLVNDDEEHTGNFSKLKKRTPAVLPKTPSRETSIARVLLETVIFLFYIISHPYQYLIICSPSFPDFSIIIAIHKFEIR